MKYMFRSAACFFLLSTTFSPVFGWTAAASPSRAGHASVAYLEKAPAVQRSRAPVAGTAAEGYAVVDVVGADDIVDIVLRGGQASIKTVRGRRPGSLRADFSSPIPLDPNLVFSLSKVWGRGNINLTSKPQRSNNYTTVVRISDPAGGQDNYRFRLDWTRSSSPSRGVTTPTRSSSPSRRRVAGRVVSSRDAGEGYVELEIDGVDDVVDVRIAGNSAELSVIRGRNPVGSQVVFSNPLPRKRALKLDIAKSYGRGTIRIVEPPNASNNYSPLIRIEDPRGGSANYKFRLKWATASTPRSRPGSNQGSTTPALPASSGQVEVAVEGADDILDIRITGDRVEYEAVRGGTPRNVSASFSTPLPRVPLSGFSISAREGRGDVVLMEGPDANNNYTATVRIIDSERAQDNYRFRFSWEVASGQSAPVNSGPAAPDPYFNQEVGQGAFQRIPAYAASTFQFTREGSFLFRAVVDETVYIKIENGQVLGMVERGRPMRVLDARFSAGYPQGTLEMLEISGVQGRGEVRLVERPWSGNNYAVVVRIHDSRGGEDEYAFELRWRQD